MSIGPLTPPPESSPGERIIELCREIVAEGIADVRSIRAGGQAKRPSHIGVEYDEAYAQGRKDTARVILIALGVEGVGETSDDRPA